MGLRGGRFTRVNMFFTGIVAILATAILLGGLLILPEPWACYADIIMHRGPTQYATVFLALWCLLFLLINLDFCPFSWLTVLAVGTSLRRTLRECQHPFTAPAPFCIAQLLTKGLPKGHTSSLVQGRDLRFNEHSLGILECASTSQ